jgi:hypothetical protein
MNTCIVSAYYKIPSKQSHDWYLPYLINWFKTIRGNIIFFTTLDVVEEINNFVNLSQIKFCILPFEELAANIKGKDFWIRQYARDEERYHSPQLGMIWYEKRHFIYKAMRLESSADIFIWCDAGCIRDSLSTELGKYLGTRNLDVNNNKIHLQLVNPFILKQFYTFPDSFIAGAIICGNRSAWLDYINIYEVVLDEYDNKGISGLSDQHVTNRCIILNPGLFQLYSNPTEVNIWFKFLELL